MEDSVMWLVWFGAAIIFFVIEILTPTFFVVCMGIGCLVAAIVSFFDKENAHIWAHLASFGLATFVSFLAIRPFSKRVRNPKVKEGDVTNIQSLIREEGIVVEAIGPGIKRGRIRIKGVSWRAVARDGDAIDIDERVTVLKIDGTTLYVQSVRKTQESLS